MYPVARYVIVRPMVVGDSSNIAPVRLSRCASGLAWDNQMLDVFLLGVVYTLAALLVGAMLAFGPKILETIEGD